MNIELIVEKLEDDFVILKTENDQEIKWPKNKLLQEIKEGQKIYFHISDKNFKKETAKDILNEILRD